MLAISDAAREAMSRLRAAGHGAWLVGGCVRKLLMDEAPADWEIATDAGPSEWRAALPDFRPVGAGAECGAVMAADGGALKIVSLRLDGGGPGGLSEALARRDFTLDALACSPDGGLIDPWGGAADIRSRVVRCVGEPERRFREDAACMLRALRRAAVLGFSVEENTSVSIHESRALLGDVSPGRVRGEMTGMLVGEGIGAVLRGYADVLCIPIPELGPMIGFEQHNGHHCFDVWRHTAAVVENTPPDPTLRWAALLHDVGKPACFTMDPNGVGHFYGHAAVGKGIADAVLRRLGFDDAVRERVLWLVARHGTPIPAEEKAVRRYLGRFGGEALRQLIALKRADTLGKAEPYRRRQEEFDELERVVRRVESERPRFSLRDLAVGGDDLAARGYRGREIGAALSSLLHAVTGGEVPNEKGALLDYLEKDRRA